MNLYKTLQGNVLKVANDTYFIDEEWNGLINRNDLFDYLSNHMQDHQRIRPEEFEEICSSGIQAPIGNQEVWAAGVTYLRSRDARMEESQASGGADFYDMVYSAERPELFFKALPHRVAGPGEEVYIRRDSAWNVPEPELTLFLSSHGNIVGYTIGNDMSSRDIEGENPLYLPQAKVYERSAALGPCLYVLKELIPLETGISISISREEKSVFSDSIKLDRMKRSLPDLAGYLFRECKFPYGCFLMTGTGMVPGPEFTLRPGDVVDISINGIGTLSNTVVMSK